MSNSQEIKTLKAHLALNVRNVDESIAFYRKLLGIEPSKIRTGYAKFDVQNPPLNLTLNQGVSTIRAHSRILEFRSRTLATCSPCARNGKTQDC